MHLSFTLLRDRVLVGRDIGASLEKFLSAMVFVSLILLPSKPSWGENKTYSSFYTPLENCKVIIREKTESNYFKEECPGRDGYKVFLEGGDDRSWLVLKKGKETIDLTKESMTGPVYFINIAGKMLEWRYRIEKGKKTLSSIIYRISGPSTLEEPMGVKSFLYVVRLTQEKWCVLGSVASNEEAHQLADSEKSCP